MESEQPVNPTSLMPTDSNDVIQEQLQREMESGFDRGFELFAERYAL